MTAALTKVIYKMVVVGSWKSGQTVFIQALTTPLPEEHKPEYLSELLNVYNSGEIDAGDVVLHLFNPPPTRRFDFMWEVLAERFLGFVVLVDSSKPQTFREARSVAETFAAYAPTPYVIAANFQDHPDAWDVEALRLALFTPAEIPIVPCVATDRESVKHVLLVLLEFVQRMGQDP